MYIDRRIRNATSGLYEGFAFRCVPKGGDARHLIKRATLARSASPENPAPQVPRVTCGEGPHVHGGVLLAAGFTYAMLEQAQALVRFGRGETYAHVARSIRIGADRAKQPGRPKCIGRPWLPRGTYVSQPRTTKTTDYDYRTPRPIKPFMGPFSRSATTVASYLDVNRPDFDGDSGLPWVSWSRVAGYQATVAV